MNKQEWLDKNTIKISDFNFDLDGDDTNVIQRLTLQDGRITDVVLDNNYIDIDGGENTIIVDKIELEELLNSTDKSNIAALRRVLQEYLENAVIVSDITDEYPSVISTGFAVDEIIANYRREI